MIILAIDPGTTESAYCVYDNHMKQVLKCDIVSNGMLIDMLGVGRCEHLVIEMIKSYGMPVGDTTFETCVWIGRFIEAWHASNYTLLPRKEICKQLCNNGRAKDTNIRAALIDRFGPGKDKAIGKKASQGPLWSLKRDMWSALAVAVAWSEMEAERQRNEIDKICG